MGVGRASFCQSGFVSLASIGRALALGRLWVRDRVSRDLPTNIAFASDRISPCQSDIITTEPDGTDLMQLTRNPASDIEPAW